MTGKAADSTRRRRPGLWLAIVGGLVAVGFAIYALLAAPDSTSGPLWIVAGWGALVFIYGLYRIIRGPSSLDDPRAGTDANGR